MRRRVVLILIFLLAGAVVNVAVALGCAVWVNAFAPEMQASSRFAEQDILIQPAMDHLKTGVRWQVHRWSRAGASALYSQRDRGFFGSIEDTEVPPSDLCTRWSCTAQPSEAFETEATDTDVRFVIANGWPLRSAWCELKSPGSVRPNAGRMSLYWIQVTGIEGGIQVSLPPRRIAGFFDVPRVLPLRPIWSGFAVNTIFYAAILWLLIPGAFVLRRFLRRRRGLCPACAYPMGEGAVCTECGIELPCRTRPAT
jgi:hypothetical protein